MSYVDGFVLPVRTDKLSDYKKLAKKAARIWLEHGALEVRECLGDNLKPGKWTSFPRSVKLKEGETVVFSYVVYKSRASRDAVMKKVLADPRLQMPREQQPFDPKRMFWGGFKTIVSGAAPRG